MFANGTILTGDCATCGDNKGATVVTRVAMQNLEKISKSIAKVGTSSVELSEALNSFSVASKEVAQKQKEALPPVLPTPTQKEPLLAGAKEKIEGKNV